MGVRKRKAADARKEAMKSTYVAKLNDCPTSPRKMRLVADLIRGVDVDKALAILKFNSKEASGRLEKLLLSAISNWQQKNEGSRVEDSSLFVKTIMVDSAAQLKRFRPAPQGRAYRIRKRSNHVTLIIDSRNAVAAAKLETPKAEVAETPAATKPAAKKATAPKADKAAAEKKPAAKKAPAKKKETKDKE
jgi:large subunit ribosomal protein L22